MANFGSLDYSKVPIKENTEEEKPSKYGYGVRHIQLAIYLLCIIAIFIGRGHMGVTIIAMTDTEVNEEYMDIHDTRNNITNGNYTIEQFQIEIIQNTSQKPITFKWSESVQQMVLYAFVVGYLIMMLPIGIVLQRYGCKLPLQISVGITGVVSLITPILTQWGGWKALCWCRLVQGLSQSGTYPSIHGLLAKWAPADESATLSSYLYTGHHLGSMIALQLAGFLGASQWGWPSTFYVIGVLCILCFLILTTWGFASPQEHKSITAEERNYIMGVVDNGKKKLNPKIPWREIWMSKHVWGTVVTSVGTSMIYVVLYYQGPTYLHYILKVDVRNSGLLFSLTFIACIFTTLLFGWLSDYLTCNNITSKNNARRFFNTIGNFGMICSVILTTYTSNYFVVVTCIILAMAMSMSTNAGFMINYIDLSPNFSGTLTSIGSVFTSSFVVFIPVIVSYIITDMTNVTQWRILFFIMSALAFLTNAIFVILVSTDAQPWNNGSLKGNFGMICSVILTTYTSNYFVVVTCIILAMAMSMSTNAGFMINYIDLSPNFSGTLTSIGSVFTSSFVVFIPVIVSYIITDMTNVTQWRILFFIMSALAFLTNAIFVILVSTDAQPWNNGSLKGSSLKYSKEEMQVTVDFKTNQIS